MKLDSFRGTLVLTLVSLLLAAACRRAPVFNGQPLEVVKRPELSGVNWDGKPFRLSAHRGKIQVVFFGYTYCPDVCPFTLAKMKDLFRRLGPRADGVEVVFVSVDPQRDSVAKLAQYVPSFDRRFYGLHIGPDSLPKAIKAFDVSVRYGQPKGGLETDTNYFVDHTANFFVVDGQGVLRLRFPPNATVDQMLADIEQLLAAEPAPAAIASQLEIRQPRALLTPGMGAAYFTVVNNGPESDRLLRVETAAARSAETHESVEDNGMMRMVPRPEGFEVPAGGTLDLKPGGKHVMLMETRPAANAGGEIPLSLVFERSGRIEVRASVLGGSGQ
jgi:protein SCO1/2